MKVRAILLLVVLLALSCSFASADAALPGARERALENGARALFWPQPGSGTVLVAVAVDAGGLDEPAEQAGLSHYLEHLLFDGFDELDERGVTESFESLSAYVNAFTRAQTTVFFVLVPRDSGPEAAEMLVGMLTRSTISEAAFEKERGVILEELARGSGMPGQARESALRALLWQETPSARGTGGEPETVQATTREQVIDYWRARYRPGAFRILIGGEFDDALVGEILAPFERLAPAESAPPAIDADPLSWPGWGTLSRGPAPESDPRPVLDLVLAAPSDAEPGHVELVARWLGDDASPLAKRFAETGRARLSVSRLARAPRDLIQVRLEPIGEGETCAALLGDLLGALDAAAATGPATESTTRLLRAWRQERALDTQRLHYAAVLFGEDFATTRAPLESVLRPAAVDPAALRDAARAMLTNARPLMRAAWLGDESCGAARSLAELEAAPMESVASAAFVAGPMGARVATLANGLVLGVLEEPGSDVFGVHLLVADRALREAPAPAGIADLIHRLVGEGSALADAPSITRRLERLGVEMKSADITQIPFDDYYNRPWYSYVRLEGPSASLGEALALLSECVRVPAWDEPAFARAQAAHERARLAGASPASRSALALRQTLLGSEHPLATLVAGHPVDELPDETTLRVALGAWPQGYFAPERTILTVASSEPAAEVLARVEDLLGGGPAQAPQRGPYPEPTRGKPSMPDDTDAEQVRLSWGALHALAPEERAPLRLAITALTDRLVSEVREKRGLSYSPGAGSTVMPGGLWLVSASVATRPEKRDETVAVVGDVLRSLVEEPPEGDELARLVARTRRSDMLRTLSAASRAYRLGKALLDGADVSPLAVEPDELSAVTPEALRDTAAKFLALDKLVLVETR